MQSHLIVGTKKLSQHSVWNLIEYIVFGVIPSAGENAISFTNLNELILIAQLELSSQFVEGNINGARQHRQ